MPVFNYTTISINGYGGKSVPNLFLRQNDPADTLAIMREEPERIQRLEEIAARMRHELSGMGFNIGKSVSPIIPILIACAAFFRSFKSI